MLYNFTITNLNNSKIIESYSDLSVVLSHYAILFIMFFLILCILHITCVIIIHLWFYNYKDVFNKLNINKFKLLIDILIPFIVYRYFFKLYYDLKGNFLTVFFINVIFILLLFFSLINFLFLFLFYFYIAYLFYFVLKKYTLNKKLMFYYILSLGFLFIPFILYDMYYRYKLINNKK